MIKFNRILTTLIAIVGISTMGSVNAASQCSGLSNKMCSSKSNECTWRQSSVNKNGVKTKAHCRALPGKSVAAKKASSKAKISNTKSKATDKSKAASKKAKAKSSADVKKKSSSAKAKVASKKSKVKDKSKTSKKAAKKAAKDKK